MEDEKKRSNRGAAVRLSSCFPPDPIFIRLFPCSLICIDNGMDERINSLGGNRAIQFKLSAEKQLFRNPIAHQHKGKTSAQRGEMQTNTPHEYRFIECEMDSKQEENQPNPEGGNEEDPTTTFDEIVRDFDEEEKKAELLFGAQDPSVCTFPEGYKPRQTVFTCLTCTPEPQMAGICYGCHLNCHEGHDIVELYTKRKFRCDCGNTKFGEAKCSLYEEKDKENGYNVYNHNYNGKFCTCDIFYPDDNRGHELLQCEICEDWFHDDHITQRHIDLGERPTNNEPVEQETESSDSLVCSACVKKLPFLTRIPAGKEPFCHSNLTEEQLKLDVEAQNVSLIISSFRKRLCKCSGCTRIYEMADCDFLLDDEDDIGAFERESKEKAAENKPLTEQEEMREIVSTMGMEGAQIFYSRVNEFKRKLGDFMNRASENGKTVTEADVKSFFGNLKEDDNERKRARFENGE